MPDEQKRLEIDELPASRTVRLADMVQGQEADFFALLSAKDELTTKHGKPFFRVAFRDASRIVKFPIWSDVPLAAACRDQWKVGSFYKLRAAYRETDYGPQLDIRRIREVTESDVAEGFDPAMCIPRSQREPDEMFDALVALAEQNIADKALAAVVGALLADNRSTLLKLPAATYNHHAYAGGFLEHVLSVAETCVYLANKYGPVCQQQGIPLDKDLTVAGGILHDIGKVRELALTPMGAEYSEAGALIGHMLQGRDMVREAAAVHGLAGERLLRLEHIVISHQRLPEWGAPKPPMTPEALLVHYADDCDAKLQMVLCALASDAATGPLTSSRNPLKQRFYRGAGGAIEADAADNGALVD